jgi:hypothetical protein
MSASMTRASMWTMTQALPFFRSACFSGLFHLNKKQERANSVMENKMENVRSICLHKWSKTGDASAAWWPETKVSCANTAPTPPMSA